jgi:DNA-binding transcriptional LysR family regulator
MDFRLIRHLYYFLVVAEERHFGRAAERLCMTQPPLSAQIKVLERVLGVELLERSRSGVRLTEHGKAILPSVKRLVENAERLESIVHLTKTGQVHSLTVGAVTSAMFHPLGEGMRRAREQFPELSVSLIEMDTGDALRAVEAEEIDIAFVRTETVARPLVCKPILREKLAVALWSEHPLAQSQTVQLADLASEGLVMCPRAISPHYFDAIQGHFQAAGLSLKSPHSANSIISQIAMVSCQVGIAIIPKSFAGYDTANVVYRDLESGAEVVTAAAVWNERRHSPIIEQFISIVAESQIV